MNIHKFEVSNVTELEGYDLRLKFNTKKLSIALADGKVWHNNRMLTIFINSQNFAVSNLSSNFEFANEDKTLGLKHFDLHKILEHTDLDNYLIDFINGLSSVDEEELDELIIELERFNFNNLIDNALRDKDYEAFFKLMEEL